MPSGSNNYLSDIKEHFPDAVERLDISITNRARELDTIHLTGVIVRLRINGVVVFTRSRIEAEVGLDNISSTTIRNRLKELVEAGVLSVDTTGDAHRFTLAVPGSSSFVPLKTWRSETESFMPIAWDGMNPREPAHAANGSRPDTKRWEVMIDAEQWPTYGQPSTICDNTDSQSQYKRTSTGGTNLETTTQSATVGSYESSSAYDRSGGNILPAGSTTNQYAVYGTIARKATTGLGGSAIIAGGVFGQQSVALAIVVIVLFTFSAWIVLGTFGAITDRWRDPINARPTDIVNRVTRIF